jgi:aryl-alcohol dehydrogenase-like predicted oxidoreductase
LGHRREAYRPALSCLYLNSKCHARPVYQVALAWLLARWSAMLAIPGTSSVRHLEENIRAAEIRLTEQDVDELSLPQHPRPPTAPPTGPTLLPF